VGERVRRVGERVRRVGERVRRVCERVRRVGESVARVTGVLGVSGVGSRGLRKIEIVVSWDSKSCCCARFF
jgi:hypothetical protein